MLEYSFLNLRGTKPVLIAGLPRCGKTRFADALAEALPRTLMPHDCAFEDPQAVELVRDCADAVALREVLVRAFARGLRAPLLLIFDGVPCLDT